MNLKYQQSRRLTNLSNIFGQYGISLTKVISLFIWLIFFCNLAYLSYYFPDIPTWKYGNILKVNGFTILIWTTVTFFLGIINTYSDNYLRGFKFASKFKILALGFSLSVMLLVMSNHILLLILGWLLMGVFMARLIGVNSDWGEAQEASKQTQKYFLSSTISLGIGILILVSETNQVTLDGILNDLTNIPKSKIIVSSVFVILSALIQSAIYPFHRWLLSAMTSPTPASALMHAGFVNGSGILLAMFSSLIFSSSTLNLLFIVGGLTAIIAQFIKLTQVNIKQKLACSTSAQMGFMIMQCGLGFFNAAVAHLILHGFYKAYLFLSSGEEIEHSRPEEDIQIRIQQLQGFLVLLFGLLGALLFTQLTGKTETFDSSIFLTLVVAITVGQITYNIVKYRGITLFQKIVTPILLFSTGILLYALMYNGITLIMADMPFVNQPIPLSSIQVVFGIIFLVSFFIMKLGVYRRIPWLYVKLMNTSQPFKKTILMYKSQSL